MLKKFKNILKNFLVPEINFKNLNKSDSVKTMNAIKKRGCVIIRDVFDDSKVKEWNSDIEKYIKKNNYYELQKEKAGLDNYFSDLMHIYSICLYICKNLLN